MARKSSSSAVATLPADEADRDLLIFEEAEEFMSANRPTASMEEVDARVKEAQEELLQLRLRKEEIERQAQQLELIRQKQERFAKGKRELSEKLSRSVSTLESELYNGQKLVEELSASLDIFTRHLEILRSLQPEKWQRSQVDEELDNALEAIDEATTDYNKANRRITALRPAPMEATSAAAPMTTASASPALPVDDTPRAWLIRGATFIAAPMVAAIFLGLILAKIFF